MSDDMKPCVATPAATFEQHITDPNFPKNEAEWWAYREIERLRAELAASEQEVEHFARLAFVDLGANPPIAWVDRAKDAEAERDALRALLREARVIVADEDRPRMDASELTARIDAALKGGGDD